MSGDRQRRNRRTGWILGALGVGMFGFGFALVPLYGVLCQATGTPSISARNLEARTAAAAPVARTVTVKFDATVNDDLPWEFHPATARMEVQLGRPYEVHYEARNRAATEITGQAIPSVVPWQATPYFTKQECFCFTRQTLQAGQSESMPLRFTVSPDLPEGINTLTLSYSFMHVHGAPGGTGTTAPPASNG